MDNFIVCYSLPQRGKGLLYEVNSSALPYNVYFHTMKIGLSFLHLVLRYPISNYWKWCVIKKIGFRPLDITMGL